VLTRASTQKDGAVDGILLRLVNMGYLPSPFLIATSVNIDISAPSTCPALSENCKERAWPVEWPYKNGSKT
jgi:hypothetical protein